MKRTFTLLFLGLVTLATKAQILATNANWKYLADGSDQGTAWRATAFDDTAWPSGAGPFGYAGHSSTSTAYLTIPLGTNVGFINPTGGTPSGAKNVTTYFRTTVNIANPSAFLGYEFTLGRDDYANVYVNGVRVYRDANLPATPDDFTYND